MTRTPKSSTPSSSQAGDFRKLAAHLAGQVVLPQDASYVQVRSLWNGGIRTRPAAIVRCTTANDVVQTVRWARSHGLALAVRGGGHDYAGRALCDGGVVIDCTQLRAVSVDPAARTARAQGGATAGDLIDATQRDGLATATGTISSVGLAGLALGGGYGALMGRYGLVADNLRSAQVVTADGDIVTASPAERADLFWGLRGGGGNFGVVVSFEYRLHLVRQVLAGLLLYPLNQAGEVLRYHGEFIKTAPDELTIQSGFVQIPGGPPVLFLSPVYCGSLEEGERVLAPLRAFGTPLADQIQPVTYSALINALNAFFPKGRHYFIQTRSLEAQRAETIEALVESARRFSSPLSGISIHHFHGAASRVAAADTAFALRRDHLMVELVAGWEPQSPGEDQKEDQQHVRWAQETSRALAPYALPGGYINLLDVGEQERVQLAFGPNYTRLLELKRAYDPDDVFRSTIGHIPPSG